MLPPDQRNVARWRFLGTPTGYRPLCEVAEAHDYAAVSPLRRACARYPDDAALAGLVADLRAGSAEFAARWDAREVREDSTARKTLRHGAVGEMTVNCDGLDVPDTDQRVVLSTADPVSPSDEALRRLAVDADVEAVDVSA